MFTEMNPEELGEISMLKWSIGYPEGGIELSKGVNTRHLTSGQNHYLGLGGVSATWESVDQERGHWAHTWDLQFFEGGH